MENIQKLKLEMKGEQFMLIKDEVLELLEKYKKLVNTQDRELFDEVFVNNDQCNLIAITRHFRGRESIYNDFLLGGIQKNYRFIELISDEVDVYEINDQLVNIVFKYHTDSVLRKTNEPFGFEGLETQVMVKEEGKWKIQHVHYSK